RCSAPQESFILPHFGGCGCNHLAARVPLLRDAPPHFALLRFIEEHPVGHLGNRAAAAPADVVVQRGAHAHAGRVGCLEAAAAGGLGVFAHAAFLSTCTLSVASQRSEE